MSAGQNTSSHDGTPELWFFHSAKTASTWRKGQVKFREMFYHGFFLFFFKESSLDYELFFFIFSFFLKKWCAPLLSGGPIPVFMTDRAGGITQPR